MRPSPERLALVLTLVLAASCFASPAKPKLLFLGDRGHHRPAARFAQLAPVLKARGIEMTYTEKLSDLNAKTLGEYDGLVIYANQERITKAQEAALLDYVASGKGLIALHCASYCFLNSPDYIALVGAQFRSHGTGVFRTQLGDEHPITKGYKPFSSWDETYTHHKHNNKDRIVIEYRADRTFKEPWTWVRTHGKGRVFYTAWGHDERTWGKPGFHALVERGIRWSVGGDPTTVPWPLSDAPPEMTKVAKDAPKFEYVPAKVPFYPAGQRWGTMGEPINKMQKPVSPADSMKHIVTPVDFEVKLFADESLFKGKPICMTWDERGRLWVALTYDYPNQLQPKGKGRDRIVIVEDTDNDGVADKCTVFAEKLSIPTSILRYKNGVIVHQAPETLFIEEKDGKEASRKVLFRGWSTSDTHAGPSNLRYGLDNWVHGIVGYAPYRGTIGGERHSFRQGFYRFKPDGSKMEFLRNTNNNSWGVGFSEEGLHFGSTANGNPSEYLPIPNRYYENVSGWSSTALRGIADNARMHPITENVRQVDFHGRFTAAAGHALYTARAYPREYWNRTAFVCEPTGHLVSTFVLERRGAGFRSTNPWNLLASDDEWCAPIMAEVGPDGHVWVLDWYNFIVQHNPTPRGFTEGKGKAYETELRDKKHGRIYRIVYKKAPKYKPLDLSKATPKELVAALKHDNMGWRLHAQRLLVERGKADVRADLIELVKDGSVDEAGLNVGAIHALWALQGLGLYADLRGIEAVNARAGAMKHRSAGVRRNAALLAGSREVVDAGLLKDADTQVRLAAMLAVTEGGTGGGEGEALAALLDDNVVLTDQWLLDGLTAAAATHDMTFLVTVARREAGLSATAAGRVEIVARHFALAGHPELFDGLLASLVKARPVVAQVVLAGLAKGRKRDGVKLKPETEKALAELLTKLPATSKASLVRVMSNLGSAAIAKHSATIVKSLLATVTKGDAPLTERVAAARQVGEMAGAEDATTTQLLAAITPRTPPALGEALLEAARAPPGSGKAIVAKLDALTPSIRAAALRVLLGRAASTNDLLDAMEKGKARMSDLALDQKQALADHPDKAIRERATKLLAKGGDLPSPDRKAVVEKMLALVKKDGDVAKGKVVFKNACAKCHSHSGEGTNIGPDLTGMAAHPKDELVIHIFDPSRSVEGNFRVWSAATTSGLTYTGMLASETRTTVEIVDAEAKRTVIQRSDIEKLEQSTKSLMPEGFEKQLKEPEIIDLLTFLTARGKYLPLVLDRVATAVSTKGMFVSPDADVERLIFPDWKPKKVGDVPFVLVDPDGTKRPNVVLLYGPNGLAKTMPKSVSLPCGIPAKAIHLLSGVSGWGYPYDRKKTVSMIVRLTYADGSKEEHKLINGEHFADYISKVDVPGSKFAFALRDQQIRYLKVEPKKDAVIKTVELVKGPDTTAPVVMAVTAEGR